MPSPLETRAALQLLTTAAVSSSLDLLDAFTGSPEVVRAALLESIPAEIAHYSDGSAALGADFYEEQRELAGVTSHFTAETVVNDRTVKIRRGIAWASEPLFAASASVALTASRLSGIVQSEVARPNRDTVLANRERDPEAAGWRRIARSGACPFCRMLADRGAVYYSKTARFASHPDCHCVAQPVFKTDVGEEANVYQYMASKPSTAKQRARLREYLNNFYPAA